MTMPEVRMLLAIVHRRLRIDPDDAWAANFAQQVPPLVDELDAARASLVVALGGEGAVPLGGVAAGIRKLAERDDTHASGAIAVLSRRGVVTADPAERHACCGLPRDDDGFCVHRGHHPIYVGSRWDVSAGPFGSVGD